MSPDVLPPRCAQGGLPTVTLFGMTINNVTLQDVYDAVSQQIEKREPGYILTPNVDHVCDFQKNALFREAYQHGFLVLADGTPILWASRLLGAPIREKISGSDLVFWLSEYAARKGYRLFLFGAAPGVAQEAAGVLQDRYPGLNVVGAYSPPIGFERDPQANAEALRIIRDAKPDICYVALGAPKQDIWSYRHHLDTGVPVHIGVGGSLDFVTGRVRRAPQWMQRAGMEWTWRLLQEPKRLAKRYLVKDMQFLPLLARAMLGRLLG
jgi:N-acetylglucosaminyldiphosphoundecaprenol N-acetyl-beta-D-mannosaminyltransferase